MIWNEKVRARTSRTATARRRRVNYRLGVEALEVRWTPASTWSGAVDSLWSTAGNWDVAPSSGDDLVFPTGVSNKTSTNDLTAETIFGSITIADSGYTVGGNSITLTGSVIASQNTGLSSLDLPIAISGPGLAAVFFSGATLSMGGVLSGLSLTKANAGALVLGGNNTYAGSTSVLTGSVFVNGSQPGSPVALSPGTTLGGTGTTGGVGSTGGILAPGTAAGGPGILTSTSLVSLDSSSTFSVALNGTTAGTGFSQLLAGDVSLGNATLLVTLGFTPTPGQTFPIIDKASTEPITGTFNGLAEGAVFTAGGSLFSITYAGGSGNDVVLTALADTSVGLTAAPNPSVYGQSVTFTATVTPTIAGPTPTGTVTFFDGASSLGTATLDGSGVATLTTSALAAGSHGITVSYAGDSNYDPNTSTLVNQVVNQAATTTVLTAAPNPSVFGQSVTFSATVSAVAPGSGTPTGSVNFFDGATLLGSASLSGGVATLTTSTLSVGSHSVLTAIYAGDTNFQSSTSPDASQVVNQASTTTNLIAAPNPSVFGESVTLTATVAAVAPGSGTPTGSVSFFDGATLLGTASLTGGAAALSTSVLSVGSHSLTAVYAGDTDFTGSTSSVATQDVNQAATTTIVTSAPNPSTVGQSVTFTATVAATAPGAGTPTGTVQFFDGATSLGTGTLSGGVATLSTSSLTSGAHSITGVYSGDTDFTASTSAVHTHTVGQVTTTTGVVSSANPSVFGQSVTFTATVTAGSGTPTGTVQFFDGATLLGSGTLDGSGVATFSITSLSVATHSITGVYSGDTTFSGSTSPVVSQVVNQASTTTTVSPSVNPSVFGQAVTLTATVATTAPGVGTPTGTVQFFDGATLLGSGTLSGNTATFATSSFSVGTHSVTAVYQGATDFAGSTSTVLSQVINAASTTTGLTSSRNPSGTGQSVTFTATVGATAPGAGTPTGTVTFLDGATTLGTASLTGGVATFSTSSLSAGTHSVTAVYGGGSSFLTSTSSAVSQVVNQGTVTVVVTPSLADPAAFQAISLTANVSASASGGATPTGNVVFFANGASVGSAQLVNGVATLDGVVLPLGVDSITAQYSGDSNYAATSTTSAATVVVGTQDERYINAVYLAMLGRDAEEAGLAYWTHLLDSGASRMKVVSAIAHGVEAKTVAVQDVYRLYLGREATTQEVYRTVKAAKDQKISVRAVVLGSREFYQTVGGGTVAGYVEALANVATGGTFSDATTAYLTHQLYDGVPPAKVAQEVVHSEAGRTALAHEFYQLYLGRDATGDELSVILANPKKRGKPWQLAVALASGDEFYQNAIATDVL